MTVRIIIITLASIGAFAVVVAVLQLWAADVEPEEPVGRWAPARPDAAKNPLIPRDLNALIWGDAVGWERQEQWQALVHRLEDLERSLGGTPSEHRAPENYSAAWLQQRLTHLETLSGPLPSPIRKA